MTTGLPQADESPGEDSRAEADHEATERMRPRCARRLGNRLTDEVFSVRVLDADLGAVSRLAQEEDHPAERGDEHLAGEAERGDEHRDRQRQPDRGRGVERNRCRFSKTDAVDRSRNERGENLQRRGEEHLADAELDAECASGAHVDQVVEGVRSDAERSGLNQEAGFASVGADGVDQSLNARTDAFGNEAREEEKELGLREKCDADDDDRQEDGVHQEHAIGADEPHAEDAGHHDHDAEGELAEDHLDADRGGRAGGLAGVLGDVVDAPTAEAGEATRREGAPEARDQDRAPEESPTGERSPGRRADAASERC